MIKQSKALIPRTTTAYWLMLVSFTACVVVLIKGVSDAGTILRYGFETAILFLAGLKSSYILSPRFIWEIGGIDSHARSI